MGFFAAGSWEKGTKNGAAVTSLRYFLFSEDFSSIWIVSAMINRSVLDTEKAAFSSSKLQNTNCEMEKRNATTILSRENCNLILYLWPRFQLKPKAMVGGLVGSSLSEWTLAYSHLSNKQGFSLIVFFVLFSPPYPTFLFLIYWYISLKIHPSFYQLLLLHLLHPFLVKEWP